MGLGSMNLNSDVLYVYNITLNEQGETNDKIEFGDNTVNNAKGLNKCEFNLGN